MVSQYTGPKSASRFHVHIYIFYLMTEAQLASETCFNKEWDDWSSPTCQFRWRVEDGALDYH